MATFKKVAGVAVLALVLAACSTGQASNGGYNDGDRTFRSGQTK